MNVTRKPKVVKTVDPLDQQYPHVLLLYKIPPMGEVDLLDFEELAFNRLQILRTIEQANETGHKLFSPAWRATVLGSLRKLRLRRYIKLLESTGDGAIDADAQTRRDDFISHFILRLVYCKTHELRKWFVARELELFKLRFLNLSLDGVKSFFKANGVDFQPISNEEKVALKPGLVRSTVGVALVDIERTDFYKVSFTEVPELVKNRLVYINQGYAYIPTCQLISWVLSGFRTHLFKVLAFANGRLPNLDDERITEVLKRLHASHSIGEFSKDGDRNPSISVESLPILARYSFPLCMRNIYDVTTTVHHLRHFGRVQFGLFLKGIGLSLENAIIYWKQEFCQLIDEAKFDKKYLYYIKYTYGVNGSKINRAPYDCKKIFTDNPGANDHHGCPFMLWDKEVLRNKMMEYGVSTVDAVEVVDLANNGDYQIACSKYFMLTHNGAKPNKIISHPNQYFEESRKIHPVLVDLQINAFTNTQ